MRDTIPNEIVDRLQASVEKAGQMGAAGAKIHYWENEDTGCSFEAGRLKTAESNKSVSFNIEVLVDGRLGGSAGNDLEDLEDLTGRAIALAKVGSAAHFDSYPAPAPYKEVKIYSPETAAISMDTLISGSRTMNNALRSFNPDLFIMAQGHRSEALHALVTSGGVSFRDARTGWSLGSYVQRTEGTDILFSGAWRAWRSLDSFFDPDYVVGKIVKDLERAREIVAPPDGEVPVFLEPEGLNMFLWPVMEGVNGRNVAKGESPLKERLGEQVLDPALTIIDDPHLDFDNGASPIDDNGIPTRVHAIFKEGVLQMFLYDLDTAGLAGTEPTGNNGCRPYSTTVPAGTRSMDELLEGIEDGLYIKSLVGFGQSNIMNGDFSANVDLGFRVKNGKIVGRVKDTMVAGNIYKMLESGVVLSRETDPIVRMPYAVVPGVHVSSR